MTTRYHGKSGSVTFNAAVASVTEWSFERSVETAEDTAMGASWKIRRAGFADGTVSVQARFNTVTTPVTLWGAEASLKLYLDATNYFEGNAICTGDDIGAGTGDVGNRTLTFQWSDTEGVTLTS